MNDQSPEHEAKPVEDTTQTDTDERQQQSDETTAPSFIQADERDAKQPDTASRTQETEEEATDRRQDAAITTLAGQIDWIEQQTKWLKYQVIASTFLGAVTLGVLVYHGVIMGKQSRVMESQNQIMTESLNTSERAYVLVKSVSLQRPTDRYGDVEIRIDFENVGRTPALATFVTLSRQSIWWEIAEQNQKTADFYFKDGDLGGGLTSLMGGYNMLPNSSMGMAVKSNWTRFDLEGHDFFVWGSISYTDIFNQVRKTRFCYRNGPNNPKEPTTQDGLFPCRYHNKFE